MDYMDVDTDVPSTVPQAGFQQAFQPITPQVAPTPASFHEATPTYRAGPPGDAASGESISNMNSSRLPAVGTNVVGDNMEVDIPAGRNIENLPKRPGGRRLNVTAPIIDTRNINRVAIFNENPSAELAITPGTSNGLPTYFIRDCPEGRRDHYRRFVALPPHVESNSYESFPDILFGSTAGVRLCLDERYVTRPRDLFSAKRVGPGEITHLVVAISWPGAPYELLQPVTLPCTRFDLFRTVSSMIREFVVGNSPPDPTLPHITPVLFDDIALQKLRYHQGRYYAKLEIVYPKDRYDEVIPEKEKWEYEESPF